MYDERYVKEHRYQADSDRLWRALQGLHMQDEPVSEAQGEAVSKADEALGKAVAIYNDREDLVHRSDMMDLFRFIDFAGKLTPLATCEKVIYTTQSPAELKFLAGYFRSKGLAEASKEASAKAEEKTLHAPDVSFAMAGKKPTHEQLNHALAELTDCTQTLCRAFGYGDDDPLALATPDDEAEDY